MAWLVPEISHSPANLGRGTPRIWHFAVLTFTLGISDAFNNPTQQAFTPEMDGRSLVPDAVAMNSMQCNATG